ncbi:response regulator [Sulfoacidibacillus thermotolerans]|uniref:Two-component system response regulator n=1 Tax=Sulfoacidibacillus thermotolerans TaxID=1765684 RepID=A0A2U3DAT2_SULT2|nr:response regulator [Sulfoacidibacillus thermotolerans]PWI58373.1 two-component system response regulator [Sulfoacidibacillus thermotolerans]
MANILVVDDAAFMRMMVKTMVERAGHHVIAEAQNGQEAVALYHQHKPDLVTMDITMPEMDGIEAVKQIKSQDAHAKVIMCSAMGQQQMVIEAIQSGASDFVVKPFQEPRLLEAIQKVLAK